jgi:hypothetical protein
MPTERTSWRVAGPRAMSLSREAGFAQDGGAHLVEGEGALLKDFEDDGAHELGVVGKVDDAGTAGAELALQLVVGDGAFHGLGISLADRMW